MDPPRILIPSGAQSPSGLYLPEGCLATNPVSGPGPLRPDDRPRESGLLLVQQAQPDTMDQLFQALPAERDLGLYESTLEDLRALVSDLPFEAATLLFARVGAELAHAGSDVDRQLAVLDEIHNNAPITATMRQFLTAHPGGRIYSEQHFATLLRLCVEHARPGDVDPEAPGDEWGSFGLSALRAMLASTTIVTDSIHALPGDDRDEEKWLAVTVQNGGYHASVAPLNAFARERMLLDLASDPNVGEPQDRVPLSEWFRTDYGLDADEQFALGFSLMATTAMLDSDARANRRSLLAAGALEQQCEELGFGDRAADAGRLVTANREWYRERFRKDGGSVMAVAWRRTPFEQRPFLRRANGELLLTAPRALHSWLSEGFHHRLVACAERRDETQRYRRYRGQLVEHYALSLMRSAIDVGSEPRVHGERRYGKGGGSKTADIAVDSGSDLVLFELVSGTLKQTSLVQADRDSVLDDLGRLVVSKVRQLHRCIEALRDGRAQLPGVNLSAVRRIWPVVVSGGELLQSELLWDYIRRETAGQLRQAGTRPLTLLDLEDFELLVGLIENGAGLVDVLGRKSESAYRDYELYRWLRATPDAPREARPAALEERFAQMGEDVAARAGLSRDLVRKARQKSEPG